MLDIQREKLNEIIGKKNLLAIGINEYTDSKFASLKKSCNDAKTMYNTFYNVKNLNLNDAKSKLLVSDAAKDKTTKESIIAGLNELVRVTEENENIIFYFSGHGHVIGEKNYIVPWDSRNSTHEELVEIDEIINILENCDCKHKLIIIDACFSGVVTQKSEKFFSYNLKNLKDYINKSRSFTILTSSGKDETSHEKSPNDKLSLFTTFIVEALQGKEESLRNGYLTINSMYDYISNKTRRFAREYAIKQRPNIETKSNGETILGIYDSPVFDDEYDLDNYSEIKIVEDVDIFAQIDNKIKISISDALWNDTKNVVNELALNGFEHGNSSKICIELHSNKLVLKIAGDMFDSIQNSKAAKGNGLRFLRQYMNKYKSNVKVLYNFSDNINTITFDFGEKVSFFIKEICVIEVNSVGFRKYRPSDIIMPIGISKKYYYYIDRRSMCVSILYSAIKVIVDNIPTGSVLIVIDQNTLDGMIDIREYIAHERVIYRKG